jgi:hypothetical protein
MGILDGRVAGRLIHRLEGLFRCMPSAPHAKLTNKNTVFFIAKYIIHPINISQRLC